MASLQITSHGFQIGRVFSRTFDAIRWNAAVYFCWAAILVGVPTVISILCPLEIALHTPSRSQIFVQIGCALLSVMGYAILQAAVTHASVGEAKGGHPNFSMCLKSGVGLSVPLVMVSLLQFLGIGLATLLLVVPGIILTVSWSVAVPVYVEEDLGIAACLGRSFDLTSGSRMKMFIVVLIWWGSGMVLQSFINLLPSTTVGLSISNIFFSTIVSIASSTVLAIIQVMMYLELRINSDDPH